MMRTTLASLALAGALLAPAAHALAAPINAPSAQTLQLTCGNGRQYPLTVTVNSGQSGAHGQGNPTAFGPGFIDGGGKVLPLSITFTFTDTSTNTVVGAQTATKGQASNAVGAVTTCTFSETFVEGDSYLLSGTVVALVR